MTIVATIIPSIGLKGIEGYRVNVEVQLLPGIEGVHIVGLPDASVKESKERVMAALYANEYQIPGKKIVINLSPAEQRKNSPIFDLAMAIGVLKEADEFTDPIPEQTAFLGVLSLDGTIHSVEGMLPAIVAARRQGFKVLYVPYLNDMPIDSIDGIELRFVQTIEEVITSFSGQLTLSPPAQTSPKPQKTDIYKDFQHVIGHEQPKRVLEIAAAGGHNVLLTGPPGCGKSLLAETFPSILPPLDQESQFDVMSIYQLASEQRKHFQVAPFREPHHSSSAVSLVGGGANPKPGEISLAHKGVLFLDEIAEYPKRTLDMLRQPMENGAVTISRAASTVTYPAQFILIGAMNPCPCGYLGARTHYCTCTEKQIKAYKHRISGPIKDRIDILLDINKVSLEKHDKETTERSAVIQERVIKARQVQYERYNRNTYNAIVSTNELLECVKLTKEQETMLRKLSSKYQWSTRVQMKIRRLARTIADLENDEEITNSAIWEAVTMRRTKGGRHKSQNGHSTNTFQLPR